MLIYISIIFISLFAGVAANTTKLHELILRVHEISDSATVYYFGSDKDFVSEFMSREVFIPISTFDAKFTYDFRKCTNVIIVFQVPDDDDDVQTYLKLLLKCIENLQVRKFAIISTRGLDSLKQYFSIFAANKFTRIFGITDKTSTYAYLRFDDNPVRQLIENGELPDALKDLNGFAFRTTVVSDLPRAFWYSDLHKGGRKHIGGRSGQIFLQFLKRFNATFKETLIIPSNAFYLDAIINATVNNQIDISMNSYFRQNIVDLSYPISVEKVVIMLPCNGYLDPVDYFQRPFKTTAWICIGLAAVYISISKIVLNSLTKSKLDIWGSFADIYLTLLSSSSGKPIVSNYRFHLLVLLFGFILERLYGSHFQSFLTANIKINQYDTIQEMEDNNVRVMITNFRWHRMKNNMYPKGLDNIVAVQTDAKLLVEQCISMRNTSNAYILEEERARFLIAYQSLHRKSLFRIAEESLGSQHIGFYLAFYSPFKEILDNFIIEIQQTGLIQKWDSDVMYQAKTTDFPNEVYKDNNFEMDGALHKPLTIYHLKFAWKYLAIGLTISTMIFAFEWIYYTL